MDELSSSYTESRNSKFKFLIFLKFVVNIFIIIVAGKVQRKLKNFIKNGIIILIIKIKA